MERRHFLGCFGAVAGAGVVAADAAPAPAAKSAAAACRITVLKRSVEQDLADRFRDGKVKQCDAFRDGQEFTAKQPWSPPAGFCPWAWADIRSYVMANFHGGDFPTVACCTDGFRPVCFRIERLEAKAWRQRQAMIQVLWEFVVQPQAVERFEQAYAPGGDWARLFSRFPGFRGTTLLRDVDTPRRYLTIDCWESCRHREEMLSQAQDDYARLDSSFADCMESEAEIGIFDVRG